MYVGIGAARDVQKNRPFQSLRSSMRDRSVLERRKRVRESVALSRIFLSVIQVSFGFGVAKVNICN